MPDFLSKIIFLQGNQLKRLLDMDVIAQQKTFLSRKFGGLKGRQCICSIFLHVSSIYLLNTYKLTF